MEPYPSVPLCLPSNFTWDPQIRDIQVDNSKPRGDVTVCKEGLAILEGVKDDYVIVICITGPARTGKSYFLSQFQEGVTFDVGHTTTSKTTGIWIALAPNSVTTTDGKVARLVLLDAEGLASTSKIDHDESPEIWDRKVFTLCALFSSYLIYNSKGIPTNDDLDKLSFMSQFSSSIQGHLSTPGESTQTAVDISPYFMWLIRDADLQPEVEGQNCAWKKFILSSVLCVEAVAAARHPRNAIKAAIRRSFQNFDAHGIPPPQVKPKCIPNLPLAEDMEQIGNEFLCQVLKVKNHVLTCAEVKSIKGFHVTGQQLALYVSSCVNVVNSECDTLPIQTAWETLLEAKCNATLIAIKKKYDDHANQIKFPVSTEDIDSFHDKESAEAWKAFTDFKASTFDDRSVKQYRKKLDSALKEKFHTIMTTNYTKSNDACEKVMKSAKRKHFDPKCYFTTKLTISVLESAKVTVLAEYDRDARGPAKDKVKRKYGEDMDEQLCQFAPLIAERTLSGAEIEFKEKLDALLKEGPLESQDASAKFSSICQIVHEHFEASSHGMDDVLSRECIAKLDSVMSDAETDFYQRNDDLSSEYCKNLMTRLIIKILKPSIDNHDMFVSYDKKMSSILQQYDENAKGPKADEVRVAAVLQIDKDIKRANEQRVLTGITAGIEVAAVGLGALIGGKTGAGLAATATAAVTVAAKSLRTDIDQNE
ncbi:guanylate-binding protein 2-like [Apostichopus japonicus]|uniref:guanylate-binding protein 2-like n=1 Tax=Stichopus japonicus TaxID=307972 RepID=UPI003AB13D18